MVRRKRVKDGNDILPKKLTTHYPKIISQKKSPKKQTPKLSPIIGKHSPKRSPRKNVLPNFSPKHRSPSKISSKIKSPSSDYDKHLKTIKKIIENPILLPYLSDIVKEAMNLQIIQILILKSDLLEKLKPFIEPIVLDLFNIKSSKIKPDTKILNEIDPKILIVLKPILKKELNNINKIKTEIKTEIKPNDKIDHDKLHDKKSDKINDKKSDKINDKKSDKKSSIKRINKFFNTEVSEIHDRPERPQDKAKMKEIQDLLGKINDFDKKK